MRIVKFKGGLGNQMFQYAFMKSLQMNCGCDVKGDLSCYAEIKDDPVRVLRIGRLNTEVNPAGPEDLSRVCLFKNHGSPGGLDYKARVFLEAYLNKRYYFEKDMRYKEPGALERFGYYDGYWQSWRYLRGIEDSLRKQFVLKDGLSEKARNAIERIKNANAVFVGIRRGDYLAAKNRRVFGSYGEEYYGDAARYIKERVKDPVFYIFSNEIEWVKENMRFDGETIYREKKDQTDDVEELFVMASCKHAIIVNSTYYWWGAWLIENADKIVVAPKTWFWNGMAEEIVPDDWVRL